MASPLSKNGGGRGYPENTEPAGEKAGTRRAPCLCGPDDIAHLWGIYCVCTIKSFPGTGVPSSTEEDK